MSLNPPVYRVLLADDHEILLDGLAGILDAEDEFEVIGQTTDVRSTISAAGKLKPDVLITDLNMPGPDIFTSIRTIKHRCPETRVIALTMYLEKALYQQALLAGACGFIPKHSDRTVFLERLRLIVNGGTLDWDDISKLQNNRSFGSPSRQEYQDGFARMGSLGQREKELLTLIGKGHSNKDIAETMFISIDTVYTHRKHIKRKLEISSNNALTLFASEWVQADFR